MGKNTRKKNKISLPFLKKYKWNSKTKKGGNPKINFAYTYFLITFDDLNKNNLISFNKYIAYQSKVCDCLSLNQDNYQCNKISKEPYQFSNLNPKLVAARLKTTPADSVLKNEFQKLMIVIKYNVVQEITKDITLLETKEIQQQILGH
jgi:hypothetical protein